MWGIKQGRPLGHQSVCYGAGGLGQSQRGTGLARPGALRIRLLGSAPWPEREGLGGVRLGLGVVLVPAL